MSSSAPAPEQADAFELSRNGRRIWWWSIYFFGAVILPFVSLVWFRGGFSAIGWTVPMLPGGLYNVFCFVYENVSDRFDLTLSNWLGLFILPVWPLSYIIFIIHYRLSMKAKTQRVFLLLMLSLVLLVCACVLGWAKEPSPITN